MIAVYFLSPIHSAQVFEGHPFIVEAGVSLGGKDVKQVRCPLLGSYFPQHTACSNSEANY